MLQIDKLRQEIEAALGAPETADELLAAKRRLGLRFIVEVREGQSQADVAAAFAGLSDRLEVRPFFTAEDQSGVRSRAFLAAVPGVSFDDLSAHPWDIAHAARAAGGFYRVAPDVPNGCEEPEPVAALAPRDIAADPDTPRWEHSVIRLPQAWRWIKHKGRLPGDKVVIGHPDTGYTFHPVWGARQPNLDLDRSYNYLYGEDENAIDRFTGEGWPIFQPGHGTHTGAVIASPSTSPVIGAASAARLAPIRCIVSVVLVGQYELVQAVDRCREKGCHVISISLGGTAHPLLREAIQKAVKANLIVVAAAGQPFGELGAPTAQPAGFSECIAVAGVEQADGGGCRPWLKSHRSDPHVPEGRITISAPAVGVYTAKANRQNAAEYKIGDGTSYATAFVAAAAALWLSLHFERGYGRRDITAQELFRRQVRSTAIHPPRFDPWFYGLMDVETLIRADLPPEQPGAPAEEPDPDLSAARTIAALLGADRAQVKQQLAEALGRPAPTAEDDPDSIEGFLLEISHILHTDAAIIQALSANALTGGTLTAGALASSLAPAASSALSEALAAQT